MKQISWSALVAVAVVCLAQAAYANGDAAQKPKDKKDEKVVTTDSGLKYVSTDVYRKR